MADVIHANNVLAHVADLNGFVAGVAMLLKSSIRSITSTCVIFRSRPCIGFSSVTSYPFKTYSAFQFTGARCESLSRRMERRAMPSANYSKRKGYGVSRRWISIVASRTAFRNLDRRCAISWRH
jgi:hypothetical protein